MDYQTGKQVLKILQEMSRIHQTTVIIVTHNAAISEIADRVIMMHDGSISKSWRNDSPKDIDDIEW